MGILGHICPHLHTTVRVSFIVIPATITYLAGHTNPPRSVFDR